MSNLNPPQKPTDHTPFYCIIHDINTRQFVPYDVMSYFLDEWRETKKAKRPTKLTELKEWLRGRAQYMYWSRCEYEVILAGWPNTDNQKKIDIYDQIVMNLPLVVEVFCKNIKFTEK